MNLANQSGLAGYCPGVGSARRAVEGRSSPTINYLAFFTFAVAAAFAWPNLAPFMVLVVVGSVGLMFAFRHLYSFIKLFIGYAFVEGLIKNTFPHPITFLLRDVFLVIIYVVWFLRFFVTSGRKRRYDAVLAFTVGGFIFYVVLVALAPFTDEEVLFRLGGARWWLAVIPLFFVAGDVFKTGRRFDGFIRFMIVTGVLVGAYGIFQYVFGFGHLLALSPAFANIVSFSHWHGLDADPELRRRVFATFSMPAGFAAAMHVAALAAIAYAFRCPRLRDRLLLAVSACVCGTALFLSGTRSAFVPFLASVVILLAGSGRRGAALIAVTVMVAAAFLTHRLSSGAYVFRFTDFIRDYGNTFARVAEPWRAAVALTAGKPFGLGISTSAKMGWVFVGEGLGPTFKFIENGYGQALVSLGWPGLVLVVLFLILIPLRIWRAYKAGRGFRALLAFAFCAVAPLPMLLGMSLYTGFWPIAYWVFAGAATAPGFAEGD